MTTFSSKQRFVIAEALLHEQCPNDVMLKELPFYILAEWLEKADEVIDGYNLIMKLKDSGVIK